MSLGTHKLPKLFLASLLLTFLATPLASAFLSRPGPRERGLQLLFRALALSILGNPGQGFWAEMLSRVPACRANRAPLSCLQNILQGLLCCTALPAPRFQLQPKWWTLRQQ